MTERRPLAKNMWYEWYDWLINHIPESVKKSARNVKLEIMKLFSAKIDNSDRAEGLSIQQCLESIRTYLHDMIKMKNQLTMKPKFM